MNEEEVEVKIVYKDLGVPRVKNLLKAPPWGVLLYAHVHGSVVRPPSMPALRVHARDVQLPGHREPGGCRRLASVVATPFGRVLTKEREGSSRRTASELLFI